MENPRSSSKKGVILSGMRPSGTLHIGNVEGALRNWRNLQGDYDSFFFVADLHALTTSTDTRAINRDTIEMVRDWVAYGIDPEVSTIFVQSHVPEHAELSRLLESFATVSQLQQLPTYKSHPAVTGKGSPPAAFLTYPVLMAADILLYGASHVPVGEDQVPHIEFTRNVADRFNRTYGTTFKVPEALLTEAKRILGSDGAKMSKSASNYIAPHQSPDDISARVKRFVTVRPGLQDEGNPFECAVYDLHRVFNESGELDIQKGCREASIRCYDCKTSALPDKIAAEYEAFRQSRPQYGDDFIRDVLREGNVKARSRASEMMETVRRNMLLDGFK